MIQIKNYMKEKKVYERQSLHSVFGVTIGMLTDAAAGQGAQRV